MRIMQTLASETLLHPSSLLQRLVDLFDAERRHRSDRRGTDLVNGVRVFP